MITSIQDLTPSGLRRSFAGFRLSSLAIFPPTPHLSYLRRQVSRPRASLWPPDHPNHHLPHFAWFPGSAWEPNELEALPPLKPWLERLPIIIVHVGLGKVFFAFVVHLKASCCFATQRTSFLECHPRLNTRRFEAKLRRLPSFIHRCAPPAHECLQERVFSRQLSAKPKPNNGVTRTSLSVLRSRRRAAMGTQMTAKPLPSKTLWSKSPLPQGGFDKNPPWGRGTGSMLLT